MESESISIFFLVMGGVLGLYGLGALGTFLMLQGLAKDGHNWRHQYYKRLMYQGASRRVAYEESRKSHLWALIKATVLGSLSAMFIIGGLGWL